MKPLAFLLLGLCPLLAVAQTNEREITSTIDRVTVFQQGAQVTRTATADLPAGTTALTFTDLTPNLDPTSIQLSADGPFTILSVVHRTNYLNPPVPTDTIQALEAQQEIKQDSIEAAQAMLEVYAQEAELLRANQTLGGSQTGLAVPTLQSAADFFRERMTEIKQQQLAIQRRIEALRQEINDLNQQINETRPGRGRTTSEVTVTVAADDATQGTFALSYVTPNAGWTPRYDVRVDDVDSPIALTYNANVSQSTGEDWPDAGLTLSTGDPSRSGTRPELQPWRLGFYETIDERRIRQTSARAEQTRERVPARVVTGPPATNPRMVRGRVLSAQDGSPLPGVNVIVESTNIGTTTDMNGVYQLNIPVGTEANRLQFSFIGFERLEAHITSDVIDAYLAASTVSGDEIAITVPSGFNTIMGTAEADYAPVQQTTNTTTTEFTIAVPYTIPADGKPYLVQINNEQIPAAYEYYAAPKLDAEAFLTARVPDWEDYDLLSGEANLFFQGTYVGQSYLDAAATEDTLVVSLGRDPGLVIERTKERDFAERQFIGNRQTATRGFRIDVRNTKRVPVTVVVEDQVPVSVTEQIEIRDVEAAGAAYSEETGLLRWRLTLPPGGRETLAFRYAVRYPKDRQVVLE